MWYAIDRFEDDQAVLQDDSENTLVVDKSLLPSDAVQGDVLIMCDGRYIHDRDETKARRERLYRLEQMLRGE
jgi:hypothetical protein